MFGEGMIPVDNQAGNNFSVAGGQIEKTTVACCVFNDVDASEHKDIDFEFEGLKPGEHRVSSYGEQSYCGYDRISNDDLPIKQDLLD